MRSSWRSDSRKQHERSEGLLELRDESERGRTKTEILREALRRYATEKRWRRLQRYGAGRARKSA